MSTHWKNLIQDYRAEVEKFKGRVDSRVFDMMRKSSKVLETVSTFCVTQNLLTGRRSNTGVRFINESLEATTAINTVGKTSIEELVTSCGVPENHITSATEAVMAVIGKYFESGGDGKTLVANNKMTPKNLNTSEIVSMESIYPESLITAMNSTFSLEDIGAGTSTVVSDLRMAISVAIMQFHQGVTPRMVPVRTATEPVVQYKREDLKIYNIAEPEHMDRDLINLLKNPKFITNELIRIQLLKDNDSVTEPVLQEDNIAKFGEKVNLLEIGLEAGKLGHGAINRTDLIADGAKLEKVYFTISNGTVTERFVVTVPPSISRLVMLNNPVHSALRGGSIEFSHFLNANSVQSNGTPTVILAGIDPSEGLNVTIKAYPELNLRNGDLEALGNISVRKHHTIDNELISTDLNNLMATIMAPANKPALYGYTPDAKYSEENLRKSQIAARIQTRPFVMPLPPAKNFILDTTIFQNEEDNGASYLTQLIQIGRDDKNITTIVDTLGYVYDMTQEMKQSPNKLGPIDPGHHYVAGSIVRPRVITTSIKVDGVTSMKDSDRLSDIRQNVQMKLNYLLETLHADTMILPQLPAGMRPVYRVLTSNIILNAVFAVPHIHSHLNSHVVPNLDGIEYVVIMDSGIRLEFITTLFDYMTDRAVFIPIIPGDQNSILSFGHNWDHGTVVGSYNHSEANATWNRMFASTREVTYPTNPMGMIVDFTGIDKAVKLVP